jgi:hypothetical protein
MKMMFQWKDRGGVFLFISHVDGSSQLVALTFPDLARFVFDQSHEFRLTERKRREK